MDQSDLKTNYAFNDGWKLSISLDKGVSLPKLGLIENEFFVGFSNVFFQLMGPHH